MEAPCPEHPQSLNEGHTLSVFRAIKKDQTGRGTDREGKQRKSERGRERKRKTETERKREREREREREGEEERETVYDD